MTKTEVRSYMEGISCDKVIDIDLWDDKTHATVLVIDIYHSLWKYFLEESDGRIRQWKNLTLMVEYKYIKTVRGVLED